jgi:hypothetical protein
MWINVDKKEVLNLHQNKRAIYPQIHTHNSNRLLNKKSINNKYYGRYTH